MTDEKKIKRELTVDDVIKLLNIQNEKIDKLFDCLILITEGIDNLSSDMMGDEGDENTIDV